MSASSAAFPVLQVAIDRNPRRRQLLEQAQQADLRVGLLRYEGTVERGEREASQAIGRRAPGVGAAGGSE